MFRKKEVIPVKNVPTLEIGQEVLSSKCHEYKNYCWERSIVKYYGIRDEHKFTIYEYLGKFIAYEGKFAKFEHGFCFLEHDIRVTRIECVPSTIQIGEEILAKHCYLFYGKNYCWRVKNTGRLLGRFVGKYSKDNENYINFKHEDGEEMLINADLDTVICVGCQDILEIKINDSIPARDCILYPSNCWKTVEGKYLGKFKGNVMKPFKDYYVDVFAEFDNGTVHSVQKSNHGDPDRIQQNVICTECIGKGGTRRKKRNKSKRKIKK
jgi:hypothetical protein